MTLMILDCIPMKSIHGGSKREMDLELIHERERGASSARVCVFLSTYNGEKYIKEQIDSILSQEGDFELTLYVRDDGSNDATQNILEHYATIHDNIFWEKGNNIGSTRSFMQLVYQSQHTTFDYYAFADQDDVWLLDKISSAIESLQQEDRPALYSSLKMIVDEKLEIMHQEDVPYQPGLLNVFFRPNAASGCTMVWNSSFHRILTAIRFEWKDGFHDAWACKLAEVFGVNIFDHTPHILYRQHERNQVGAEMGGWRNFFLRLKGFRWKNGRHATQYAKLIYNQTEIKIPADCKEFLRLVAECPHTIINNIRVLRYGNLCKEPFREYVRSLAWIILGRY